MEKILILVHDSDHCSFLRNDNYIKFWFRMLKEFSKDFHWDKSCKKLS